MSTQGKDGGADALRTPVEAIFESWTPDKMNAILRSDSGVLLQCGRDRLPANTAVGSRVLVEKAMFLATLGKWIGVRVLPAGTPAAAPADDSGEFWTRTLGALATPAARLDAITRTLETLAMLSNSTVVNGRTRTNAELETYRATGHERLAELVRSVAEVAPTHTLQRLALRPSARAHFRDMLTDLASRVPPDLTGVPPALVTALDRLRGLMDRGTLGQAALTAPASPYERAEHHQRVRPPSAVRELLALTNGFTLHDGMIELAGIFDKDTKQPHAQEGRAAGTISIHFASPVDDFTAVRLYPATDGRLVTQALAAATATWRELPVRPMTQDLTAFLGALAALGPCALRDLFRAAPLLHKALGTIPVAPQQAAKDSPEPAPVLPLEELRARLEAPAQVPFSQPRDEIDKGTREDLTWLGRQVSCRAVLADAARVYGFAYEFLSTASPTQRELLRSAQDVLPAGVHLACKLRALKEGTDKKNDPSHAYRLRTKKEADRAFAAGLLQHAEVYKLLDGVRADVSAVWKPAAGEERSRFSTMALADSLDALASSIRSLYGRAKSDLFLYDMLRSNGIYYESWDEPERAAEDIRTTAAAAAPRAVTRIKKAELRFQKGVNLYVLDEVIAAFAAAHARDASVPLLRPRKTRHVLEIEALSP